VTFAQARGAAVVRILTGVLFVAEGYSKITGAFVRGTFVKRAGEMAGEAWPFWAAFLNRVVIPNATAMAWVVAVGELAVGVGLVLGLLTRIAAVGGALLVFSFLLGQSYVPGSDWSRWVTAGLSSKLAVLLLLLLGIVDAGRVWGLDSRIGRRKRSLRSRRTIRAEG
jgi:thiosulfate dehydrogenase [quinone] large subunit